jgi:hypothetical protein
VLPIFHPAAALYDQSKREVLFEDFKRLKVLLERELQPAPGSVDREPEATRGEDRPEASDGFQETLF